MGRIADESGGFFFFFVGFPLANMKRTIILTIQLSSALGRNFSLSLRACVHKTHTVAGLREVS